MEYDVCVIGSGPGGYLAALRAAELGLKAVCIEKESTFGGTCLNIGCIPSKALLQSTEQYEFLKHEAALQGIIAQGMSFDFSKMQERKEGIVKGLVDGISFLFKSKKVTVKQGVAKFISPEKVRVGDEEIIAKNFIIATGSEPSSLPFLPFDEKRVISSTGALALSAPPKKMCVIGAGVIGLELASVYNRLGADVVMIELLDRICPTMDGMISKALLQLLKKQGLKFHLGARLLKGSQNESGVSLAVEIEGKEEVFDADVVLVAVGRRPYHLGLGLEDIGIKITPKGIIEVDGNFKTNFPHIYAIGDVIDGPMLAHRASIEGMAVAEMIAGRKASVNYMAIPNVIYTHPEAASVGLTEEEARAKGFHLLVGTASFKASGRARCIGFPEGFVKVIAESTTRRIIGVHMVGPQVSELIGEAALAIQQRVTLDEIAALSHAHPTLSETFHEAVLNAKNT